MSKKKKEEGNREILCEKGTEGGEEGEGACPDVFM